jgi:PPIC-type PPIASE domain
LSAALDSSGDLAEELPAYVSSWVTRELLYQEAVQRGLADESLVRKRIEDSRKRIIIDALLEEELYNLDSTSVGEDAIETMYRENGAAFTLREDVVQLSFAQFSDRDAANQFRSKILRGTRWAAAIADIHADSAYGATLAQVATRQYFSKSTLYPEELWKVARTLGLDEVSFVVKTSAGYYVLQLHNLKKQGDIPDLDYVRNEIRDRILIARRKKRYEELLTELRAKFPVTLYTNHADSASAVIE